MPRGKKVGCYLFRRLPWYGKLLVPVVILTGFLYLAALLVEILCNQRMGWS